MKSIFTLVAITLSSAAIAASYSPPKYSMKCTSRNGTGNTAEWLPQFGELTVDQTDPSADPFDQDALDYRNSEKTGANEYTTDIVYNDGDDELVAQLVENTKTKKLVLKVWGLNEGDGDAPSDSFDCEKSN